VVYYISLASSNAYSVFNFNKLGEFEGNNNSEFGISNRKPSSSIGENLAQLPKMPSECYLKNDLDVEFISTMAKKTFDTKTKVMYQNKNVNAFRLFDKMIRRITNPHFTNPRRKNIDGDMVPCELTDNFLIANSAGDLVNALGDVIEEKLQDAKIYGLWKARLSSLQTLL